MNRSIALGVLCLAAVFPFVAQVTAAEPAKVGIADKTSYLRNISLELKKQWPKNRTVTIVCHGHSVPAGYFAGPVDTFNAYPHLLHQGLKAKSPYAVINVIVTAIGGETSEGGAKRFDRDVVALHPDLVTIDYVINDTGLGLEKSKKYWCEMIEKSQKAGAKVILLTPTGLLNCDFTKPGCWLNPFVAQVYELAAKYHVGVVDSKALFVEYVNKGGKLEELMSQGNHPNRRGHELVAHALLEWFPN